MQWWCAASALPWTWSWRPYPGVWLFIGLLAGGFFVAHRVGGRQEGRGRPLLYLVGLGVLWLALDWPIGALGAGYLASVHMVQFLLIAMVAPPFLLIGWSPRSRLRHEQGGGSRAWHAATHPVAALGLFTVLIGVTHWPLVVDGLMGTQLGNMALDLVWVLTGLIFWWPVVVPAVDRPWLTAPVKIGYLIAATILNTGVFAYLTFSELPLYATFELAPPIAGISTRDDQLVAGLLMKIGGAVVLWSAITVLFFTWYGQHENEGSESVPRATPL